MTLGESFPSTLAAARSGADWAWAALYRDLVGPVTGYLAGHGGREPEDLAAETFLQVAKGIHAFAGDEPAFRSWVFVIAHRRLQDDRRHAARQAVTVELTGGFTERGSRGAPTGDAEREAVDRLASAQMLGILGVLTDDQRHVVLLRVVGDLSLEATAQMVGKKPGAVKALQRRALETLRKEIAR